MRINLKLLLLLSCTFCLFIYFWINYFAVPGTIGTLQALEAIKLVSGIGASYVGKMLLFDGFRGGFTEVKLRPKQSTCSACGDNPTIVALLEDYPQFCGAGYDDKVTLKNV